jgi:putative membrane protein
MKEPEGFTWYQIGLVAFVGVVWAILAIDPVTRTNWLLENALVAVFAPLVLCTARYFRLSNLSYTLMALYMVLHLVGSHYDYSNVPFGETLGSWFGSNRNCYDRLVHFCFGFLLAYPMREVFHRIAHVRGFWGYFLPLDLTLSLSAIYEIVEWSVAAMADPSAGATYLGAQGDIWDAQKDMALAGLGALIAMTIIAAINWWYDPNFWSEIKEGFRVKNQRPLGEVRLAELIAQQRAKQAQESPASPKGKGRKKG